MSGADPWSRYWRDGGGQGGKGCLPAAADAVADAQRMVWTKFAAGRRKGGRLLDLATGSGIVLRWIAAARPDLRLTGVDAAPDLPPAPRGITLKGGVSIEKLPFRSGVFDAATSQFGFEYGETEAAANELARVLRPGAALLMMVHHRESPIVAHNAARRDALLWVISAGSVLEKAKALARACAGAVLPPPGALLDAPEAARRMYPAQPVAAEVATGVLQRLKSGRTGAEALAMLAEMERDARGEVCRIDALCRVARDAAGVAAIAERLARRGFRIDPPATLADPQSRRPLAWLLSGTR